MAAVLNPYVAFPGTTRDAVAFYASVFGGTPDVQPFGEMAAMSGAKPDDVMHARLDTPAGTLMAADSPAGSVTSSRVSLSLSGEDEAQLRGWWDGLADGATIGMPLAPAPWGDVFGALTDRFGIDWMVNIVGAAGGAS